MAVTPQNLIGSFAQGQQIQANREAREIAREDRARDEAYRNKMAQLLAGGIPRTPEAQRGFMGEVARYDPGQALDWGRYFEGQKEDVLGRHKAEAPFFVSALQSVKDQASYDAAKQQLSAQGVDVSDMPPTYDPGRVNMALQGYRYIAEGPQKRGGPFEGTGLQAQAANILLTADPSSPEYASAYGIMSQPRSYFDAASGQFISVTPDMSAYRPPAGAPGARAAAAAPGAAPRTEVPEKRLEPAQPMGKPGAEGPTVREVAPGVTVTSLPKEGLSLTKGEEARDKEFGKEYVKWTGGGQADAEKNITQLEEQIRRLESGENLTGPVIGRQPRAAAEVFTPGAVDVQEQVEEVVQRNLREVLGAQFTEREGERLISRAFNPRLDEATNAARLRRLVNQMRQAAEAKSAQAAYFDQFGTLQGYQGPQMPTMSQMEEAVVAEETSEETSPDDMDFRNMSDEELRKILQ